MWRAGVALVAGVVIVLAARPARAQATPATGSTRPDDTPSIKIGALLFADYTYQQSPVVEGAAGDAIHSSSFNVTRAYVNVVGSLSHIISFRITPDVVRAAAQGSSIDGSMTYRLKYAYAQVDLDDWLPRGTWVKFGMQQTPFIDSIEGIYRYRFQGTLFTEREGYMASADLGVTFRTAFPGNYGDVHVGLYNGEGYSEPEVNDQKALMARVGLRPLPRHPVLGTWRVQGFWTRDNYMKDAPRNRSTFNTTFEHRYVNIGYDYLWTTDNANSAPTNGVDGSPTLEGSGWSIWLTPKKPFGNGSSVEALVRYDHMRPGGTASATGITSPDGLKERTIAGAAYWFQKRGSVSAAVLLDYERLTYSDWTPSRPTEQRFFVHTMIGF
jgi:hypothetical protein